MLKLSAKKVYDKAIERRIPLHQVHDFCRKYAVAYVEHMSAPKEPPKPPPQMSFLGRVLTTYFPSTDYLFRAAEVVPNRGSELGSFLHKRGALWRAWKQRWFKLNSQLGVVSYHLDPHVKRVCCFVCLVLLLEIVLCVFQVLTALGTIAIADIATVEAIPGGMAPYEHVFRITTSYGRQFDLAADSAQIMNYWLDGLTEQLAARHLQNHDKRLSKSVL